MIGALIAFGVPGSTAVVAVLSYRFFAFWLPTISCLEQMALAAGFVHIERVSRFNLTSVDGQYSTPHGTIRAITY